MKQLNKQIKRNFAIFAIIFSIVLSFPQSAYAANDKTTYNRQKAVEYARAHWNDGVGVCDVFVKACLDAGGVDIQAGDVTPVMEALVEAGFGAMVDVKLSADGKYVKKSDNPTLEAGDVLSFYCNTCGDHSHTVLIAGFDKNGNAQTYGHNKPWNLVTTVGNYKHTDSDTGITHEGGYSLDAIHMYDNQFHKHVFKQEDASGKKYYDAAHPHEMLARCECGISYHLGWNATVSSCAVCNPPKSDIPEITLTLNSDNSVSLKWTTIANVDYFQVLRGRSYDGEYKQIGADIKGTTFKNSSTKNEPGTEFFYKIRAVKKDGSFVYSYVASIVIAKGQKAHIYFIDEATEPTCISPGYTEGVHCSECGKVYTAQKEIPATGHKFDSYVSNGNGTMNVECSVCGHTETVSELVRIKGKNRYETSFAIAEATKENLGVEKFSNVLIANGNNFADALAGSYLAKVKSAPIIMASGKNNADIKAYLDKNLVSGGMVYILGGTGAIPETLDKALSGYNVKRVYGKSRYETNIEILKEAGVEDEDIIVSTGTNFADSLSASAAGKPILLVDGKKGVLTALQKEYLGSLDTDNFYIVGGTGAVSENFETLLADYGTVERIKGASRYETSVEIAKKFFTDPSKAVVAYAWNFPDGLSGGPLAMSMNAPMILTQTNKQTAAKAYMRSKGIKEGAVLGGASLIDDATAMDIFNTNAIVLRE